MLNAVIQRVNTRTANLNAIAKAKGWGPADFVSALGRSPSFWSDRLRGVRAIGEKLARSIEDGLGLGPNALDKETEREVLSANAEPVDMPRFRQPTPVVGTARLGHDGYYDELQHPVGHGDGTVDNYSGDPNAYALRVKGDSMHPAIRHGSFVIVEPNGRCVPGEYVALSLSNGKKMVKELIIERTDEIVIESVNGNHRETIERSMIETMHPIAAVIPASKWRPG